MSSAIFTDDSDWCPGSQAPLGLGPRPLSLREGRAFKERSELFAEHTSDPKSRVYTEIHERLVGMLGYFAGGEAGFCFAGSTFVGGPLAGTLIQGVDSSQLLSLRAEDLMHSLGMTCTSTPIVRRVGFRTNQHIRSAGSLVPGSQAEEALALICPLSGGGILRGAVATFLPPQYRFDSAEPRVRAWGEALNLLASSLTERVNLIRWIDVTKHLGHFDGVYGVVDVDLEELVWAGSQRPCFEVRDAVLREKAKIVELVCAQEGNALDAPYFPTLELQGARLAQISSAQQLPSFGKGSYSIVAVRAARKEDPDIRGALSRREEQVAQLLAEGYTVLNAAAITGLSENTVKTYVRRVYKKLEVTSRTDLVKRLYLHG